ISVHNQGTSIHSADIGQLFRPYVRLQPTGSHQGSGLGLYITKCIVEAHGGRLRLEPHTGEGQGTTVSFELPLQLPTCAPGTTKPSVKDRGVARVTCRNEQVLSRSLYLLQKLLEMAVW